MGPGEIIALIEMLFGLIFRLYNFAKQVAGSEPIPTLEEIYKKNADLQAEIDAEKAAT